MIVSAPVRPAFQSGPSFTRTLGPEVADLAAEVGFEPDPEQRLGLDLIFALDGAGKSAAFEFAVICSRQNLKTGLFKQAALGWLFITEQPLVVWSAHEFPTAREAFRDMVALIEGAGFLSRRVQQIYTGAGNESIELKSGCRLKFKARTHSGGRGLTGDKIVLDEAFALQPEHIGALMPTLTVVPDPQVMYGSSAGLSDSGVLRGIRDRGRPARSPRLAYLEWCAPEGGCASEDCMHEIGTAGCALDDVDNWRAANPLLGRTRANGTGLTEQYIRDERQAMPAAQFGRERLGWWDAPDVDVKPIPVAAWLPLASDIDLPPSPVFYLDAWPNAPACIGGAALHDGKPYLALAGYDRGLDWLVDRAVQLQVEHPTARFAALGSGLVSALFPALREAGIEPEVFTVQDLGRACGHLQKLVADQALAHSGDPLFVQALSVAVKRDINDDLWVWSKRLSGDISPLVAVTGAAWLLESAEDNMPAIW